VEEIADHLAGAMSRASRPLRRLMRPVVWCIAADRVHYVAQVIRTPVSMMYPRTQVPPPLSGQR
jgi:hypothetical protein